MDSEAFVQLALEKLSCSQKELATCLGVSPSQISKWKNGEHMSPEFEKKFRNMLNLGDQSPSFVVWAGSIEDANKWDRLIHFLAEQALQNAEKGHNTYPLMDEYDNLAWHTSHVLKEMGVAAPKAFPKELEVDYDSLDLEIEELLEGNPVSALIYDIYLSLNDVYGFYAAYLADLLLDEELDLFNTPACNIESCLLDLAACKLEQEPVIATKYRDFQYRVKKEFNEWIAIVKEKTFRAGIPLGAELLDLVYRSADELGHDAEAESLGVNQARLHPDIYMNELLVGMRIIHQVLPVILEKLGIDQTFTLDEHNLRIR